MAAPAPARAELRALFAAAVARVAPEQALARGVSIEGGVLVVGSGPVPGGARLVVLAAGKAAAAMGAALEARVGDRIREGLAVTKRGCGQPLRRLRLIEAGHPLPDEASETAGREALALAARARTEDVLVVLLSGGASALLACPLPGLALADVVATTGALLASGADIDQVNVVRKHLTALSGGRLARHTGAGRVEVLAISDVPGDAPHSLASGPCAADPSSHADAVSICRRFGIWRDLSPPVRTHLEAGVRGERPESLKPGDPAFDKVHTRVLASNRDALAGAREAALRGGMQPVLLGDELRGEAREIGWRLAALAKAVVCPPEAQRPRLLVGGGETTVTLRGQGLGGRSQELALAAAIGLDGRAGIVLLAAGSDGNDGPTEAAGAFADGETVARGHALGLSAEAALACNDSHSFFCREGGLLVTGPTRTNVRDLVLLRIGSARAAC